MPKITKTYMCFTIPIFRKTKRLQRMVPIAGACLDILTDNLCFLLHVVEIMKLDKSVCVFGMLLKTKAFIRRCTLAGKSCFSSYLR